MSDSPAARRADGSSPVRLQPDTFESLCSAHGLTTVAKRLKALDVSMAHYYRVLNGVPVGAKFIDACLTTFGSNVYGQLFERIEAADEQPAEVAS